LERPLAELGDEFRDLVATDSVRLRWWERRRDLLLNPGETQGASANNGDIREASLQTVLSVRDLLACGACGTDFAGDSTPTPLQHKVDLSGSLQHRSLLTHGVIECCGFGRNLPFRVFVKVAGFRGFV
jgi:hypothetical protein